MNLDLLNYVINVAAVFRTAQATLAINSTHLPEVPGLGDFFMKQFSKVLLSFLHIIEVARNHPQFIQLRNRGGKQELTAVSGPNNKDLFVFVMEYLCQNICT